MSARPGGAGTDDTTSEIRSCPVPMVEAMELRPMGEPDVAAVHEVAMAAFAALDRAEGREPGTPGGRIDWAHLRIRRLLATDPGGAWVAEAPDGTLAGAALALVREGLWGLSLLVVDPRRQSAGLGRALLDRALAYGDGARGGIILASSDPRALRAYARAGFALEPALRAAGLPRDVVADPAVRAFEPGDHPLAAEVDRAVRGAAHGDDLDALLAGGCSGLVLPDRGYAITRADELKLLAAHDAAAAAILLRAAIASVPGDARIDWLTARQGWAIDAVLDAGLALAPGGAVFVRGDVGPFHPYLPGGAYL